MKKVIDIKYKFYPQPAPNSVQGVIGSFTILNDEAMFMDEKNRVVGILQRPRIIFITHLGIRVDGFEQIGFRDDGTHDYRYCEWFLAFALD